MDSRDQMREELICEIISMGYPAELGELIADHLRSEKTMYRMLAYLRQAQPDSAEEIVDEMLSISAEVERWREKKTAEYYNAKYNELLYSGLESEEDAD